MRSSGSGICWYVDPLAQTLEVFALAARGAFSPAIARAYPLDDYAATMRDAASVQSAGRVVLVME